MLEWLLGAAVGPAVFALPVNWGADALAGVAQRWFKRLRRTDDLSRLVRAATGTSVDLTQAEFDAVRKLLQDQQTWTMLGQGTVEDLADRIADCLPPRDGRTTEDSRAAALTIARGLIEFAVADLEPKLFQQVLMARLRRMETDQASALDGAMFDLHDDLTAGFAGVMDQFKLVLDRLPPGPARRGELAVYLRTLIDWLNTDPWPRDPQFGGPVLTPAAIERKLRITTAEGPDGGHDLDADELARQCGRLVILGGPGSGKTWLAKRIARRCAENALQVLAAGGTLDEVELPLYTTCSRLFGAGGDIREAAVSSALGQLADLGGSRISKALRGFFAERNAPTLLVLDSLDEAHGPSERLRQAGTLPWRIVLTSRPSTWRKQLTINDKDDSHRVGELQPLRYPGDVEPFIEHWFAGRPEWGNDLAAQIARRPDLQQAATVPLILAFYCIIGGTGPLPGFRRELYTKVLNRMLTGRWRDDDDRQPDADTCLQTLRAWAWDGAASNHPISGVGTWTDDIPTKRAGLGEADADALDHVATPLGPPDPDTRKILRRFIHRSIREHLVAEHVASLAVDQAAEALLPHIWYDLDWEYAAPAAIAMHPQHDQLVRDLICRAARSDQVPGDLSVIDAGWEFRGLLAQVASESCEADWSPEVAGMIGQARVDLARSALIYSLGGAAPWAASNRQAREALLGLLAGQTYAYGEMAGVLADGVIQLDPTAEDQRRAREALLGLLAGQTQSRAAGRLARGVAQLDPTAEDKRQAREALLGLLARETSGEVAGVLADGVARLATTAEDKRQAREALLGLLARETSGKVAAVLADGVARLATTAEDKRQAREALLGLLARKTSGEVAGVLADGVARLATTAEDKRQAREALLGLLARETSGEVPGRLAAAVIQLDPTAEDKHRAREALLGLLARETSGEVAGVLADGVARLATTAEDKHRAFEALLGLLARKTSGEVAGRLAAAVAQLDPTAEDKHRAREALLGLLARETSGEVAGRLAAAVAQLDPTAEDKHRAFEALLGLLPRHTDSGAAVVLADAVAQLDPTAEDKHRAFEALLGLLARQTDSWAAVVLADAVIQLDPTAEDKRQAREALLGLLARRTYTYSEDAEFLAAAVARFATTAEDKRQAREAMLELLAHETERGVARRLAVRVAQLDPTAEDKHRAREALLGLLARQTDASDDEAGRMVAAVAQLATTAEDKRQAREALLGLLARQTVSWAAVVLADGVAQLDPTVRDLSTWRGWADPPTVELLAAVRRNSAFAAWLEALPSLMLLSSSPA